MHNATKKKPRKEISLWKINDWKFVKGGVEAGSFSSGHQSTGCIGCLTIGQITEMLGVMFLCVIQGEFY